MYRCEECGALFANPQIILTDRHKEIADCVAEFRGISPCCCGEYAEMRECFRCGEYSEHAICDECIRKDMTFEHMSEYISAYDLSDDFLLGFYCKTSQQPNDTLREITRLSFNTLNKTQQTETMRRYIKRDFAAYAKWYRETL